MTTRSWMSAPALALGVALLLSGPAHAADTATIYDVVQEGMTAEQAKQLNATYGLDQALMPDGSFNFVGADHAKVPQKVAGEGKDEAGRPVVSQALDFDALGKLRPLSERAALAKAGALPDLAGVVGDLKATPRLGHTELETADREGKPTGRYQLDTSVSYDLTLGGLPAHGQGAKLRVSFAGDGSVTQLNSALRQLKPGKTVPVISPAEAAKGCAALYASDVRQGTPTLGYEFPELGAVKQIFPMYTCNPVGGEGEQANLLLPAVRGIAPEATFEATLSDGVVKGFAKASGGTAPYSFKWSSSTTTLEENSGEQIAYIRSPRDGKLTGEALTLVVTDANGVASTATANLNGDGSVRGISTAGGGGFGLLSTTQLDVGIEQTVDEWQCAQDSAVGFKSVMASHGVPTVFDFRGTSAWEQDFKKVSGAGGGDDVNYADNVDATWYTGHGGPSGFTFKNTTHDDNKITPADANWGDRDMEWLMLESCQVLKDTNGQMDQLTRWGGSIDGLHIMNGFHTNAQCVGGGTGRTFAEGLFPLYFAGFIKLRDALTVRGAWANMAYTEEPSGTRFRSIGNIGAGGVTNIDDHFWGQGWTGPDISKASRTGMWSLSGLV